MDSTDQTLDRIETTLLYALNGFDKTPENKLASPITMANASGVSHKVSNIDIGDVLGFDEAYPKSMYTLFGDDDTALFAGTEEGLVTHPKEIVGDELEVLVEKESGVRLWLCFRYIGNRLPKKCAAVGRVDCVYEVHHRFLYPNGHTEYAKRILALNKNGKPVPVRTHGEFVPASQSYNNLITCCSTKENAHKTDYVLARFSEVTEVVVPIDGDAYKAIFSVRDAPVHTNSGRKKAILHNVAAHVRRMASGQCTKITTFNRGITDFNIGTMHVGLSLNSADSFQDEFKLRHYN
jgi:hypothetical protein